ncbi:trypsin-like peptidase domain-containing protein [Chloroflexota bacterium]
MTNKAILTLLVFILLTSLGLAYYSHTLNQQIEALDSQLVTLGQEQNQRSNQLDEKIASLREETNAGLDLLSGKISETESEVGALGNELENTRNSITSTQGEIAQSKTEISDLQANLNKVKDMSAAVINAEEVFQEVSHTAVRISNGERTIGSGFLYDSQGHVVTAYHVIEDLSQIYVIFPDGRVSLVTDTAISQESDVAILTITNRPDFDPPPVANSDEAHIGEPVVAIGSPFDMADTMTAGIISQVNRFTEISSGSRSRWIANLIQFDAPANFGNSGCPLFNARGEVVGMVIARVQPGEGDGIYYAVSANKLRKVADALIANGSFAYPWVGVNISDLTPEIVQDRGLDSIYGALVRSISPESPAEATGIVRDDVIVGIDGFAIRNVADLTSYLGEHRVPGEETTLQIIRGGNELNLSLTVGTSPS